MAFNANIPQANNRISASQSDILNNFISIGSFIDPDTGTVKKAELLNVVVAPATSATQMGLYAKNGPTTGTPEVFLRRHSAGSEIPITEKVSVASNTSAGWSYLPSGLIIQWGPIAVSGADAGYTFAGLGGRAFPSFCFAVFFTPRSGGGVLTNVVSIRDGTVTNTGFTARSYTVGNSPSPQATPAYFFAIGI